MPGSDISSADLYTSPLAGAINEAAAANAPQGVANPTAPGAQWGHSLIDTRAYGKLRGFNGKEEDWGLAVPGIP